MRWIDETWVLAAYGALKATLDVDGHTRKQMIEFLFEEGFWDSEKLTWDAAIARWNANLNPNKPEIFKIGELWALMRRFDRHQMFHVMAADLGYELRRIPTEERRQALLERMVEVLERCEEGMASARADLARLDTPVEQPRSLSLHGPKPQFSREHLP